MSTQQCGMELHEGYEPGFIGRIAELHGRYYARVWGAGAPFEALVSRDLCAFLEGYDPERDLALSAHLDGRMVGGIAIVGSPYPAGAAQLRFFIVDPAHHGRGVGKALIYAALDWCCERGLEQLFLWTVDNLPQSRGLYEKVGFRVVECCPDDRYTVHRDNLKLELCLDEYRRRLSSL